MIQSAEPLFSMREVITEYASFVAIFATLGAVGFRFVVMRGLFAASPAVAGAPYDPAATNWPPEALDRAARLAARVGLVGAMLGLIVLGADVLATAAEKHMTVGAVVSRGGAMMLVRIVLGLLSLAAFAVAAGGSAIGWPIAAAAVLALQLRNLAQLRFATIVNPLHVLGGGLWIGTLFVMLAAGVPAALMTPRGSRGRAVADMVNAFSPLALISAALLAVFGVITAWRHLKYVAALWTTPYGWTFLVKLALVLVVLAFGAWNWRRVRPTLGDEAATSALRRSATSEVVVAAVVLAVTALLVSLPSPKRPAAPNAAQQSAAP